MEISTCRGRGSIGRKEIVHSKSGTGTEISKKKREGEERIVRKTLQQYVSLAIRKDLRVECMNEPEWCAAVKYGGGTKDRTKEDLRDKRTRCRAGV